MRKFFITYSIILGAIILVAVFQLLISGDQLPIGDVLSNIQDRWFLFAAVVFGGSAAAAFVMTTIQNLLNRGDKE